MLFFNVSDRRVDEAPRIFTDRQDVAAARPSETIIIVMQLENGGAARCERAFVRAPVNSITGHKTGGGGGGGFSSSVLFNLNSLYTKS